MPLHGCGHGSFQLFRFEVIGERISIVKDPYPAVKKAFPTIPIWSNRWTDDAKEKFTQAIYESFPTIPIWSNRWTFILIKEFQLMRNLKFPTIPIWSNRWTKKWGWQKSQLWLFPTIPIWSNRWTMNLFGGSDLTSGGEVSNYSDLK